MFQESDTHSEGGYHSEMELSMDTTSTRIREEDVTVIWFDPHVNTTNDIDEIKEKLRTINNSVLFPTDVDSCVRDFDSTEAQRIFLIVSSKEAYQSLRKINNHSRLDSIFIFPTHGTESNDTDNNDYQNVAHIFDNVNDLLTSIEETITQNTGQLTIFPIFDQKQKSIRDLSEQPADFLWFQLAKDVIQKMPHDDTAKQEMLTVCRQEYQGNEQKLKSIDEFDREYRINNCIRWYTKDTFVYLMINKILRTQDIEQLCAFRWYIADLSNQLLEKYDVMNSENKKITYLYRGALIRKTEVDKVQANIGQLIAPNGYWSTSLDRSRALIFASKLNNNAGIVHVLFEIDCTLYNQHDSVIFADITELSQFQSEVEYLFDADSVFQIENIRVENHDNSELYTIQLKISEQAREITRKYKEAIQDEMKYESPKLMLGILLKRLGKTKKSLEYYEQLLKNPGEENLSHIYNRLGMALRNEGNYHRALECFDEAYKRIYEFDTAERIYLAFIRHNQGQMYFKQRRLSQALKCYEDALSIVQKELKDRECYIAELYTSIGRVYSQWREYETALNYHHDALKIRKSCFPSDHVILAFNYIAIGTVHYYQGNYSKALNWHFKALKLREKYLPINHHNTAWSLHYIGKIYYQADERRKALSYYLQSLEKTRNLASNSPTDVVPKVFKDIALYYDYNPKQIFKHYRFNTLQCIRPRVLARIFDHIAYEYKSCNRRDDSLKFYHEALQIREETLPTDDFDLSHSYKHLAALYEEMGNMNLDSALAYYQKTLDIYKYHYNNNDEHCRQIKSAIRRIKQQLS